MLKLLYYSILALLLNTVAYGSGGRFDKEKEGDYQLIVFGKVTDAVLVVMSEGHIATAKDLKKEQDSNSRLLKNDSLHKHKFLTTIWTGKLTVDKVLKGDAKVGDILTVTWTDIAQAEYLNFKTIPGIVRSATGCESKIYNSSRFVFGLNATAKHVMSQNSPIVWKATEGSPDIYEKKESDGEDDIFK